MNKENQLKFINENYELYCTHSSKRKIRHNIFSNIETENIIRSIIMLIPR